MKYFRPVEFQCRCDHDCGLAFDAMDPDFLEMLDDARRRSGVPFRITSSVRCTKYNAEVGGSIGSAHLTGQAVDIHAEGSHARIQIIAGLLGAGFHRIGVYPKYIHVDADQTKIPRVMWLGDQCPG